MEKDLSCLGIDVSEVDFKTLVCLFRHCSIVDFFWVAEDFVKEVGHALFV